MQKHEPKLVKVYADDHAKLLRLTLAMKLRDRRGSVALVIRNLLKGVK
jgi:hypothetical protein